MDIQKEREAFEKLIDIEIIISEGFKFNPNINQYYHPDHTNHRLSYAYLMGAWMVWQEKAQADQKVKLLLCDEHLKKCESPTGVFNSQYPDEEPCLICLAKEAKAQAVPEGFVLVSKDTLNKALNPNDYDEAVCSANELLAVIEAQQPYSTPGCPDEP